MNKKDKLAAKNDAMSVLQDIMEPINSSTEHRENDTIAIQLLIPYSNHPFKLYDDERLIDMVRSIKEMGVLLPIIVRPAVGSDKYEILSGHNRVNAAKEAGLLDVPAIVKNNLSDDEAKLIVTETNLVQRSFSDLSHSERAVALKSHMDAVSKQGKRNDLLEEIERLSNPDEIGLNDTSGPMDRKLESREIAANKYGLNASNVSRYIRLNHLIQPLLERVDSDEIAFRAAVSISYLSQNDQTELNRVLNETNYKLDIKKAESLRELSKNKKITGDEIVQILSGGTNKKPVVKPSATFLIKRKMYLKYFTIEMNESEVEAIIDTALVEYFEKRKN